MMTMADDDKTPQIFLSWSGELSRQIAIALQRWIDVVFESLHAWVSDTDIALGARSIKSIEESLDQSIGGLLILTVENQTSPWVNFEAGALSRQFESRDGRVIPLLVDATHMGQLKAPLNVFQGQMLTREGMLRVVEALFEMVGRDKSFASSRMDAYWPKLESEVERLREEYAGPVPSAEPVLLSDLQDQLTRIERMLTDRSDASHNSTVEVDRLLRYLSSHQVPLRSIDAQEAEHRVRGEFERSGLDVESIEWSPKARRFSVKLKEKAAPPIAQKIARGLMHDLALDVFVHGDEEPPF